MDDCVFCKIVEGKIPSTKLWEDADTIAFLDISPVSKGHALVMPKKHFSSLIDCPHSVLEATIRSVQKVAGAVVKGTRAEGCNIFQNNGAVAGQSVSHMHFHVVPRKKGDGLELWTGNNIEKIELEELQKLIKQHL